VRPQEQAIPVGVVTGDAANRRKISPRMWTKRGLGPLHGEAPDMWRPFVAWHAIPFAPALA
jgi:hypothetical protein